MATENMDQNEYLVDEDLDWPSKCNDLLSRRKKNQQSNEANVTLHQWEQACLRWVSND